MLDNYKGRDCVASADLAGLRYVMKTLLRGAGLWFVFLA